MTTPPISFNELKATFPQERFKTAHVHFRQPSGGTGCRLKIYAIDEVDGEPVAVVEPVHCFDSSRFCTWLHGVTRGARKKGEL